MGLDPLFFKSVLHLFMGLTLIVLTSELILSKFMGEIISIYFMGQLSFHLCDGHNRIVQKGFY